MDRIIFLGVPINDYVANIIQAQLKHDGSGDYEVKFNDTQAAAFSQDQVNQIHIMKENELPDEPAKVVSHKKKKD